MPEPAADGTPESTLLARCEQQTLRRALEALPLPQREIVLLADLEEMSYREIASVLGIPAGTVMSRLARARAALRAVLAAEGKGAPR